MQNLHKGFSFVLWAVERVAKRGSVAETEKKAKYNKTVKL